MVSEMAEHKGEIKMIKIYKVNSFEKLEYLLNTLHERGVKWCDGCSLGNEEIMFRIWKKYGPETIYKGLVIYNESGSVMISSPGYIYEAIKQYEQNGEKYIVIHDVKLPKPKEKPSEKPKVTEIYFHDDTGGKLGGDRIFRVTEEIQVQPCQSDPVQPNHYRQGSVDLFEPWYLTYPFNEFRAIMKSHIAKYLHRYQDKNGTEDLDKASYCIKRLREYEEREANE